MGAALAFDPWFVPALQRPAVSRSSHPLHLVPPSPRPDDGAEVEEMSFHPAEKFFTKDEHRRRIAAALRRRLYPLTSLHSKQLADAIGVTPHTVTNWTNAYCDPGSYEVAKLHQFFGKGFWAEVFGDGENGR